MWSELKIVAIEKKRGYIRKRKNQEGRRRMYKAYFVTNLMWKGQWAESRLIARFLAWTSV